MKLYNGSTWKPGTEFEVVPDAPWVVEVLRHISGRLVVIYFRAQGIRLKYVRVVLVASADGVKCYGGMTVWKFDGLVECGLLQFVRSEGDMYVWAPTDLALEVLAAAKDGCGDD